MSTPRETNPHGQVHPDATAPRGGRVAKVVSRVLSGPFIGFVPWIVLSLLSGPSRMLLAAGVALALSVVFVAADRLQGRSIKILGVVDVVAFTAFLLMILLASHFVLVWMETWFGEISNIILVAVVVGSMLARVPFTIQYAQEQTDPSVWRTPVFRQINYIITGAWGLAFLVSSSAGFYGDAVLHDNSNFWTGWAIQIVASLVAVQFTDWYPRRAQARALERAGKPVDETAPPVVELVEPLCGIAVVVGVLTLVFSAAPTWFGVVLIVVGAAAGSGLRRASAAG
jgi:hypothetical protein